MKNLLVIIIALFGNSIYAGVGFPGVDYAYVKIYLLNIERESKTDRPDSYVYKEGVYAKSKIGDGLMVDAGTVDQLNRMMSGDINSMLIGMSKCYEPRHGFIYFDKDHQPVASVSICFECQQIKLWTIGKFKYETDFERFSEEKGIKQFTFLEKHIVGDLLPVYSEMDRREKYITYISENNAYMVRGEITMKSDELVKDFTGEITLQDVNSWLKNGERFTRKVEEKIAAGGRRYSFAKQIHNSSSFLYYDDSENPVLAEAKISSVEITLPNGIRVGMSMDQVMSSFLVYDGPENPEMITLENDTVSIKYHFKYKTLQSVEIKLVH